MAIAGEGNLCLSMGSLPLLRAREPEDSLTRQLSTPRGNRRSCGGQ